MCQQLLLLLVPGKDTRSNLNMSWKPPRKEIQNWLTNKEVEVVQKETQNLLHIDLQTWKNMYLYSNKHEIYNIYFHVMLYEWIKR